MGKRTILFVNGHLRVGGVEKALTELLSWVDYGKYDVDLLLLQGLGDYRDRIPPQVRILEYDTRPMEGAFREVVLGSLGNGRFRDARYRIVQALAGRFGKRWLTRLRPLLPVRKQYDVAIAFRHDQCAETVAYAVRAGKKYCWWHHGEVPLSDAGVRSLRDLWDRFDKVVTVSDGCRRMLEERFRLEPGRVAVVPNLIDGAYLRQRAGSEDPYGKEARTRIVTLTRISPEKHVGNVVRVAGELVRTGFRDFVWFIVGDGASAADVRKRIAEMELEEYVVMTGELPNPYPYVRWADMMVHPSYVESQGIAVLEGMALGIPVVAVRTVGTGDYLVDGRNGILVGPGEEELLEGVKRMLALPAEERRKLTEAASETLQEGFSGEVVIKRFEELI